MSKLDDIEMACPWCNRLHPITAEGITQLKDLMLELIGEDEPRLSTHGKNAAAVDVQNELRQWQRQKVSEL